MAFAKKDRCAVCRQSTANGAAVFFFGGGDDVDNSLVCFLSASVLLTLAPGPDNIYLLTKSLADGAKSGVALTFGLATGIIFHTSLVIFGVAALVKGSPLLFAALKYFGAGYLLFLASRALRETGGINLKGRAEERTKLSTLYKRGVLMNVLNPKVLLFFLAFLPQFADENSANLALDIAVLGALFAAQVIVIFSLIALFAGRIRRLVAENKNINGIMGKVQAAVLAVIAVALVLA